MGLTIGELLSNSARKFANKEAVVFKDQRLDYKTLNERANRVGNMILGLGLKKGDRCAILFNNCELWAEIYCGLAKAGVIAVPINFRLTAPEIEYLLTNSQPKTLIYEEAFSTTVNEIRTKDCTVEHFICLGPDSSGVISYEELLKHASCDPPSVEVTETDTFYIVYTSGTTGFPKGAVVPHRNLIENNIVVSKEYGNLNYRDRQLLIMPIFHANSARYLLTMLMLGATAVVYHSAGFNPEEILQIIEKEKITFTSVVPTMLSMILNLPDSIKQKYDVSSLTRLNCSSAPLMTKTKEETLEYFKGVHLFEGYGSTETGSVTVLRPEDQMKTLRSVGVPTIGKIVRLLDEDGNDVKPGDVGEVYVKGFGVALKEYWRNPKATAEAFRGEWCTVGDMARVDKEGYLYLEDRKKDMIISGGENVYPSEVENVLVKHPAVLEAAVVGIPDELWGEMVHASIVTKNGISLTIEEITCFCKDQLAGYKRPKSIEIVEELPKSPVGKILRSKVREQYWGQKNPLYI